MSPTFSIITPFHLHNQDRRRQFLRTIASVAAQSRQDCFEHIIIDDGSPVPFEEEAKELMKKYSWLKYHNQKKRFERIIAYNKGLEMAKNDWICFLDSDDAYTDYYLEAITNAIAIYPKAKVFNFSSIHMHTNYRVSIRGTFQPKMLEKGHEVFGGGRIVNGTFAFKRECYEKLGGIGIIRI